MLTLRFAWVLFKFGGLYPVLTTPLGNSIFIKNTFGEFKGIHVRLLFSSILLPKKKLWPGSPGTIKSLVTSGDIN